MRSEACRQVERSAANPANAAVTAELHRLSYAEAADRLAVGPLNRTEVDRMFGAGKWRPQVRFGVHQGSKVRAIDNARSALINAAATTYETVSCITVEFAAVCAAVVLWWCMYTGIAMVALGIGLDDMRAAYRRIPTSQPWYTVYIVWDVRRQCVAYFYLPGHPFGALGAVLNFNRFPKLMVCMARALFAVMVDQYFDDYMTIDAAAGLASAQGCLALCHDLVGQSLEMRKHKPLDAANVGLGHEIDLFSVRAEYAVYIRCTPDRIEKVLLALRSARRDDYLSPGTAAVIRGKLGYLLTASYAKVGRAATQPLLQREYYDRSYTFGLALQAAHDFFETLLPYLPSLRIPLVPDGRPPVVLYTDAMFRPISRQR